MLRTWYLFLLAVRIVAQVITDVWFPHWQVDDPSYVGSVIDANGDIITISMHLDAGVAIVSTPTTGITESYFPTTLTIGPTTWATRTAASSNSFGVVSSGIDCSRASAGANATCTRVRSGGGVFSSLCASLQSKASRLSTRSEKLITGGDTVATSALATGVPEWCKEGMEVPDSLAVATATIGLDSMTQYQVVLTAGWEKLSPTGTSNEAGTSRDGSATASDASSGLATPTKAANPQWACLGAAMAAFVL